MVQLKLLLFFSLAATLGTSECHAHDRHLQRGIKLGLWLQLGFNEELSSQKRPVKFVKPLGPLRPSIPSNEVESLLESPNCAEVESESPNSGNVESELESPNSGNVESESESPNSEKEYVLYPGYAENVLLSVDKFETYPEYNTPEMCGKMAAKNGAHFWIFKEGNCFMGTLLAPICRSMNSNQEKIYILEEFLTDGSPNDDPFPSSKRTKYLMHGEPHFAFRMMPPTAISKFPELTTEIGHLWEKPIQSGKVFKLSKLGGFEAFSVLLPIDPSCYTNSSCGVPFLTTSVKAVTTRHVALDQVCGEVVNLDSDAPMNVFSHQGIGCKLFPCIYPTPNCELTVTSCYPILVNAFLSNFRKETCGGYKLRVLAIDGGRIAKDIDMCEKDGPETISVLSGKVKILFSGNPEADWDRYGFNIRLDRDSNLNKPSLC